VTADCLFCGNAPAAVLDAETRMTRSAFHAQVIRCRQCRLVFAWPRPSDTGESYEECYFDAHDEAGLVQVAEAQLHRFRRRLLRVAPHPGRLLEIGVGRGGFLVMARELGWAVSGVDVSRWAAEQIARQHGIRVMTGELWDVGLASASFDVVHMSHVLEHVPDPVRVLEEVRRVLKPDGRVIIEVPNELENVYTWARLRLGTARPYPVTSTHLWFFTPPTLARVVKAAGFTTDHAQSFRDVDDPRLLRRVGKRVVRVIERLVDRAPLIEVVARPATTRDRV
jgi:SAM-dependent methyltransferase